MLLLEPSDVIELFINCLYTLRSNKQDTIKGVLSDGLNWHCFNFHLSGLSLRLTRYVTILCNNERGVWNQWNGMMEWTTGMEHWNGILGWTGTRSLHLHIADLYSAS